MKPLFASLLAVVALGSSIVATQSFLSRGQADRLYVTRDVARVAASETDVASAAIPNYTTNFPDAPTWFKMYRRGDGTWRTDISWLSMLQANVPAWTGYTVTYVMPSASGASNANDGSLPVYTGGTTGPKVSLSGLISDATNRIIVLEAGYTFDASTGWAGQDLGANKIIVSSVPGNRVTMSARIATTAVNWTAHTVSGVWYTTDTAYAGSGVGGLVDLARVDAFGGRQKSYTAASLAACESTVNTVFRDTAPDPDRLYYNSGQTTPPDGARTYVYTSSSRHIHNNPTHQLYVRDVVFDGGPTVFSSINGNLVSGATNASPIVITTPVAHNLTDGQQVTIENVAGNTNANGTYFVDQLTTTTFALYTDAGLTTPRAGSGTYTASTGIYYRGNLKNGFYNCVFRYSLGNNQNVAEFAGFGHTILKLCVFQDGRADGVDGRAKRYVVEDQSSFFNMGADGTKQIDQGSTAHSGSRFIRIDSEYYRNGGPNVQDIRENAVPSYSLILGSYFYDVKGVSSPASNYGIVSGVGASDGSVVHLLDPKWSSRDNTFAIGNRKWRANGGTMRVERVYAAAEKTVDATGVEVFSPQ